MAAAGHSRHRKSTNAGASLSLRLMTLLRVFAGRPARRHRASGGKRHVGRHLPPAGDAESWLSQKQVSLPRVGAFVALSCLLIWAAWQIISDTAAYNEAVTSPRHALRWANNSAALVQMALNELQQPKPNLEKAQDMAQQALRAMPLDDQALLVLGIVAEQQRDDKRADMLARMAGERTWRNPATHLWLLERAVRRKDYGRALEHADAVLRVKILDQRYKDLIFPTLVAFVGYPPSFQALEDFFAANRPTWRADFLLRLTAAPPNLARLAQLYAMLMKSKNPPTEEELRAYLNALIRRGFYEQAYRVWQETLPQGADRGLPYNGDFNAAIDGAPFNWRLISQPGAQIEIVKVNETRGYALQLQFSGTRVNFANVSQLLLLTPGRYDFSFKAKAEDFRAARGLWWHIFCEGGSQGDLAHTDLVSDSLPWTDFGVEFEVPVGCKAQWLQLELPARIAPERKIEGRLFYQALRISKLSSSASKGF